MKKMIVSPDRLKSKCFRCEQPIDKNEILQFGVYCTRCASQMIWEKELEKKQKGERR